MMVRGQGETFEEIWAVNNEMGYDDDVSSDKESILEDKTWGK